MEVSRLLTYCLFLFSEISQLCCQNFSDSQFVVENLVNFYKNGDKSLKSLRPVKDQSLPVLIVLTMHLYSVDKFDAVTGQVDISGGIFIEWKDQTKHFSIGNFSFPYSEEGYSVMLSPDDIWTPSVRLTNAVDSVKQVGDTAFKVRYQPYDGRMLWNPKVLMRASCKPDVQYYPFDRQECSFVYTVWGYTTSEIQLDSSQSDWYLCNFKTNGVWRLVQTEAKQYESHNQAYMKFTFRIEREPMYFVINAVCPILLLSGLNGFVFLLPAESEERVSFAGTCFLSLVFMLQTVISFLPQTADPMSMLCFYVVIMLIVSVFVCIISILTIRIYLKPITDTVPRCLQKLYRLLTCKVCKPVCRKSCKDYGRLQQDEAFVVRQIKVKPIGIEERESTAHQDDANTCQENDNDSWEEHECRDVTWPEIARLLDLILFMVFVAGQAVLSMIFLVPLAQGQSN